MSGMVLSRLSCPSISKGRAVVSVSCSSSNPFICKCLSGGLLGAESFALRGSGRPPGGMPPKGDLSGRRQLPQSESSRFQVITRVVAHEIVHAIAPEHGHDTGGLLAPKLRRHSLTSRQLDLDPPTRALLLSRLANPRNFTEVSP